MDKEKIIAHIVDMLQAASTAQCALVLEVLQHMFNRS